MKAATVEQLKLILAMQWVQSLIAIVIALVLWRLADAGITRFFARRFVSRFIPRVPTYASLAKSLTRMVIMVVLALELLSIWQVDVAPALWSAGALSVVLGFGAQTIIRDMLAGLFFLFDDTFDIGDGVELTTPNGVVSGVVEAINFRETRIVDSRGAVVSVPNGNIVIVANTTRLPTRIRLNISVPLRSGIVRLRERIGEIAGRAARSGDLQVDHIAVQLEDVAADSATFSISFHVAQRHQAAAAASSVREMVVTNLQAAGVLPGASTGTDGAGPDASAVDGRT